MLWTRFSPWLVIGALDCIVWGLSSGFDFFLRTDFAKRDEDRIFAGMTDRHLLISSISSRKGALKAFFWVRCT